MSLGIPYMGSKRKLSGEILKFITSRHQGLTDFYDLFGGGGSVSFTAIRDYRFNVHYNELNSHIYHLVKYLQENKTLEPKFYEWVTREMFFEQTGKSNDQADWYSGFVMSCWSFGNSQTSYLYGDEVESIKRMVHNFLIFGCLESMKQLDLNIPEVLLFDSIHKRRVIFSNHIRKLKHEHFQIENLERVKFVESMARIQNLQNLQSTNLSYEMVEIKGKNPVIYCDIPYKGTGEYKEVGFNHESFYEWARNCPHPVYISEYAAPFQEVKSFSHRSSLSATNNAKKTIEKVFWNGKGDIYKTELF